MFTTQPASGRPLPFVTRRAAACSYRPGCRELFGRGAVLFRMRLKPLVRSLVKMPMFSSIAILTIAIGIGANTAIFSVIDGVLLKPLPYPGSSELVTIDHSAPGINLPNAGAAPFLYFIYREDGRTFEDVGLWNTGTVSVTGLADPEEAQTLFVTDGVLPMLGVRPALGRVFTRADAAPGSPETVVL